MNNNNHHNQQQQPKLENFLGRHSFGDHDHTYGGNSASADYMFPNCSLQLPAESQTQPEAAGAIGGGTSDSHLHSNGASNSIGLSMIKSWLRNQPLQSDNNNNINTDSNNNENGGSGATRVQSLALSMSTGSQSSSSLPLLTANVSGESSSSENKQPPATTVAALDSTQTVPAAETVQRKSIDTFGQRTSIYRGVTRFFISLFESFFFFFYQFFNIHFTSLFESFFYFLSYLLRKKSLYLHSSLILL